MPDPFGMLVHERGQRRTGVLVRRSRRLTPHGRVVVSQVMVGTGEQQRVDRTEECERWTLSCPGIRGHLDQERIRCDDRRKPPVQRRTPESLRIDERRTNIGQVLHDL